MNLQLVSDLPVSIDDLQVVVIDCAYNSFSDPFTQKLFGKFVDMKLRGFLEEYEHGIVPLGAYDFVGTILLVCEKKGAELEPIFCFKSSTLNRAQYFSLPFELLDCFHHDDRSIHKQAVQAVIQHASQNNINLGYNSSWTIDPRWRSDPRLKLLARELSVAVFTSYYRNYQIQEILIGGALRFKVDRIQAFLGFEYLKSNGENLPPLEIWFAKNEKVALMHLKQFSKEAIEMAEKYQKLWDRRITIDQKTYQNSKKAA